MVHRTRNGDVELAYETFGSPAGEPLLLIMGFGYQMVWWPDSFCELLAERGFHVARFDNRDSGLSTHFPHDERPVALRELVGRLFRGNPEPAYTSVDMAADAVQVMNALGWESCHVVGASMGGMLAQLVALRHPDRVRTLVPLSSRPGQPARTLLRHLDFRTLLRMTRVGRNGKSNVETMVDTARIIHGRGRGFDEQRTRAIAEQAESRRPLDSLATRRHSEIRWPGDDPTGIRAPTLVLHGADDPIMRVSAARAIANAVPGAELVVYPGMGHLFSPVLEERIADDIGDFARRAVPAG